MDPVHRGLRADLETQVLLRQEPVKGMGSRDHGALADARIGGKHPVRPAPGLGLFGAHDLPSFPPRGVERRYAIASPWMSSKGLNGSVKDDASLHAGRWFIDAIAALHGDPGGRCCREGRESDSYQ